MDADARAMCDGSPSAAPAKTYPRPDGKMPRADEKCPLCKTPPNVGHRYSCPWSRWAQNPEPADG